MSRIIFGLGTQIATLPQSADIDLDGLLDVTVINVQDNQVLQYNTVTEQWENSFVDDLVTEVDGGAY
jgi:hypothetical protein